MDFFAQSGYSLNKLTTKCSFYLLCIYIELSFFHVGAKTVIHSGHKAVIGNSRVEEHICRQAVLEMDHNSQQPANLVNKKMEVILMFLTCVQLVHVHVLVHSCTIINMYLIKILKRHYSTYMCTINTFGARQF